MDESVGRAIHSDFVNYHFGSGSASLLQLLAFHVMIMLYPRFPETDIGGIELQGGVGTTAAKPVC
jgi:hypothetical protein